MAPGGPLSVLHFGRKPLTRNAPNPHSFTSKSLRTHDKDPTLNQRVQGSNPCTPTNDLNNLGPISRTASQKSRLGSTWEARPLLPQEWPRVLLHEVAARLPRLYGPG